MIIKGSRYTQSTQINDGAPIPIAVKSDKYVANRTVKIISNEGDTFDKIAARVLGDSTQYWKIAGLNSNIRFPDVIPTGTVVIVPVT